MRKLPDLTGLEKIEYHRFYLYTGNGIDLRVQQVGDKFELERKIALSDLTRNGEKIEISLEEFELLKELTIGEIIRDSYVYSQNPLILLRVYHGKYEGLIRTEVEFQSEDMARNYHKAAWMEEEITHSPLGRDSKLLKLSAKEFNNLLLEK